VDTRSIKDVSRDELIRLMVGRTITDLFPKQDVQAGEVVLKVENLGRVGAFRDVSFELRRGEIVGMAGLVGAGRTNVARAIFGVEPPQAFQSRSEVRSLPQQAINLGWRTSLKTGNYMA
jgi:ABC-type sugar transport system ATPase subunit